MSKIALLTSQPVLSAFVLIELHKITGKSISFLRNRVKSNLPIVEETLFHKDHEEISLMLKTTIDLLMNKEVSFDLYKLGEKETFENPLSNNTDRISVDALFRILNAHGMNY